MVLENGAGGRRGGGRLFRATDIAGGARATFVDYRDCSI